MIHSSIQQDFAHQIASPFPVAEGQGTIDFHITKCTAVSFVYFEHMISEGLALMWLQIPSL
jgi:hypothetical protein